VHRRAPLSLAPWVVDVAGQPTPWWTEGRPWTLVGRHRGWRSSEHNGSTEPFLPHPPFFLSFFSSLYLRCRYHLWWSWVPAIEARILSYPVFMSKPSTHRMHDLWSIVTHIQTKVFTDNQKSRIKYNYYINNVSKDYDNSQVKRNNGRHQNTIGMTTLATRRLELCVEEFQPIFSFWAAGLSSRGQ
jgi:hypothetical protein